MTIKYLVRNSRKQKDRRTLECHKRAASLNLYTGENTAQKEGKINSIWDKTTRRNLVRGDEDQNLSPEVLKDDGQKNKTDTQVYMRVNSERRSKCKYTVKYDWRFKIWIIAITSLCCRSYNSYKVSQVAKVMQKTRIGK